MLFPRAMQSDQDRFGRLNFEFAHFTPGIRRKIQFVISLGDAEPACSIGVEWTMRPQASSAGRSFARRVGPTELLVLLRIEEDAGPRFRLRPPGHTDRERSRGIRLQYHVRRIGRVARQNDAGPGIAGPLVIGDTDRITVVRGCRKSKRAVAAGAR